MQYTLGDKIQDGGEGVVFKVQGNKNRVIKVYHEKDKTDGSIIKTPELYQKLQWMAYNPPRNISQGILAWPTDLYFGNSPNKVFPNFKGFVMPRLDFDVSLEDAFTYKHPIIDSKNNRGYEKYLSVRERIEVAIDLCAVLNDLQKSGLVIGDFNKDNIGVILKTRKIVIMDCDSFHLVDQMKSDKYRCNRVMPGYLAPEILDYCDDKKAAKEDYDLDKIEITPIKRTFTEESDNFCLAVHIFNLLMNGVTPYNGIHQGVHGSSNKPSEGHNAVRRFEYVFRQGREPNFKVCLPRNALPDEIANYFDLAFSIGRKQPEKRPTAEEWIKALVLYKNNLRDCLKVSKHQYFNEFKICPYCYADTRYIENLNGNAITTYPSTFFVDPPPPPPPKTAPRSSSQSLKKHEVIFNEKRVRAYVNGRKISSGTIVPDGTIVEYKARRFWEKY
jgi:DNA-binding helix-hairpin-helix protein with protein kinase domain